MNRCHWCNLNNSKYVKYHDEEWGILNLDDHYLFEMLLLESFQAGLSWECVLNKRDEFRRCFLDFDAEKITKFTDSDIELLLQNEGLIRNRLKMKAAINNAKVFLAIKDEYSSFKNFLYTFWDKKIIFENNKTTNSLSDSISKDLKKRGMKFVGSTIIYSFLQAVGIINSHEESCFLYQKE